MRADRCTSIPGRVLPALLALALLSLPATDVPAASLTSGNDAPLFTLKDLNNREVSLGDHVGPGRMPSASGVLLVFFASWCPVCRQELPLIDSLVPELRGRGVEVLLIGYQEDREVLSRYLKGLKVRNLTALVDLSGRVGKRYNLRVLPTICAVTAGGKVKELLHGESKDILSELRRIADAMD